MISWTLTLWAKYPLAYKKSGDRLTAFISQKAMDTEDPRGTHETRRVPIRRGQ
jgi:hypothetical protein